MPSDPLEARLSAARPTAAPPPHALLGALRHRRRARRAAGIATLFAATLAITAGAWLSLSLGTPAPQGTALARLPDAFLPTIRALSVANPTLDADHLRLPTIGTASSAEPMSVRSFDEVGG